VTCVTPARDLFVDGTGTSPPAGAGQVDQIRPFKSLAIVVVPTVVHEVNAAINCGADNANAELFFDLLEA